MAPHAAWVARAGDGATPDGREGSDGTPNPAAAQLHSALSVVDSTVTLRRRANGGPTGGAAPCIIANSSLYLSDVYASGCADTVRSGGRAPLRAAAAAATHLRLVGLGRPTTAVEPFSYAFPAYVNGRRRLNGIATAEPARQPPPHDLASRHWVGEGGVTWQTAGAVAATEGCGARADGIADDWAALQRCVDAHRVVVLPKGFYRLSKPLRLSQPGGALVGVGRTLSLLMPTRDEPAARGEAWPLLEVAAARVTVGFVSIVTWDHMTPPAFAVSWAGSGGVWRQAWFNRMSEASFPPFSAPADGTGGGLPPPPARSATPIDRPLSVISGGGRFYDFNLDFGCCFGTAVPPPSVPVGPDMASSAEVYTHGPAYRTLLVNGSASGVGFYPLNAEQDFGEAHAEVAHSRNVSIFGAKSENNYVVLWVRDSSGVSLHGYGGNASPFPNATTGGDGMRRDGRPPLYMPSLFRVQRSTDVRLANLIDAGRITSPTLPSAFVAAGNGTDPRAWNMVLRQDAEGGPLCTPSLEPGRCDATRVLDRPVLWQWKGWAQLQT